MAQPEEIQTIAYIAKRLRERFPGVPPETVNEVVANCHQEFDGHPIRNFIPVLVERQAVDRLQEIPGQRQPRRR